MADEQPAIANSPEVAEPAEAPPSPQEAPPAPVSKPKTIPESMGGPKKQRNFGLHFNSTLGTAASMLVLLMAHGMANGTDVTTYVMSGVGLFLALLGLFFIKKKENLLTKRLFGLPKVGDVNFDAFYSTILFLFHGIGALIITNLTYTTTSNAYFAAWAGCVCSIGNLGIDAERAKRNARKTSASDNHKGPLIGAIVSCVVLFFATVIGQISLLGLVTVPVRQPGPARALGPYACSPLLGGHSDLGARRSLLTTAGAGAAGDRNGGRHVRSDRLDHLVPRRPRLPPQPGEDRRRCQRQGRPLPQGASAVTLTLGAAAILTHPHRRGGLTAAGTLQVVLLGVWIAAAFWLTFSATSPFTTTGNGYFATWLGLISFAAWSIPTIEESKGGQMVRSSMSRLSSVRRRPLPRPWRVRRGVGLTAGTLDRGRAVARPATPPQLLRRRSRPRCPPPTRSEHTLSGREFERHGRRGGRRAAQGAGAHETGEQQGSSVDLARCAVCGRESGTCAGRGGWGNVSARVDG